MLGKNFIATSARILLTDCQPSEVLPAQELGAFKSKRVDIEGSQRERKVSPFDAIHHGRKSVVSHGNPFLVQHGRLCLNAL